MALFGALAAWAGWRLYRLRSGGAPLLPESGRGEDTIQRLRYARFGRLRICAHQIPTRPLRVATGAQRPPR
jgi:hypothetical protein